MFKTPLLGALTAALSLSALAVPTAASAQRWGSDRYDQAYGDAYRDGYNRGPRSYRDGGYGYGYGYRGDGRDRGYPQRCSNGATGTIVGAIAGGLLGNSIAGRGDRSLGTILGAGGGALAGRAIDRSGNPRWCR